jgi:arginine decarboxylase
MNIPVTYGTGSGLTELSAFDSALNDAGVANYNILHLSSVIPPEAVVEVKKTEPQPAEYGHRLYAVLSSKTEIEPGKEAWAGLGWIQDETGRGLFVEHQGGSEAEVKKLIRDSLGNMRQYRQNQYGEVQFKIVGIKCADRPVCALVCAPYLSEGWEE